MRNLLLVGIGGFLGAALRYGVSSGVRNRWPDHPHAGTFLVNMLGCLCIGFVMGLATDEKTISESSRLFIVTGCLGAVTTFSTFGYETILLVQDHRIGAALVNVAGQLLIGLLAVLCGLRASSLIMG